MPAQGTALGIGSRVENSNALKGQNRFVVKNLVSPFQGLGRFSFGSDPQGRPRKRGSPRLGFPVSAPSGRQKQRQKCYRARRLSRHISKVSALSR